MQYTNVSSKERWRELLFNKGRNLKDKLPEWVKNGDILLLREEQIPKETIADVHRLVTEIIEFLGVSEYLPGVDIGDICSREEFKSIFGVPQEIAYGFIGKDYTSGKLSSYGRGYFLKGFFEVFGDTVMSQEMRYTIVHELCEFLSPPDYLHCEEHPIIQEYLENKLCALY